MFFTQCKGTDRVENYISRGKKRFPVKMRHIKQWHQFWEPVILSLWDSKTDRTYWECVQSYLSTSEGKIALAKANKTRAATLRIPIENVLNEHGCTRIKSITRIRCERLEREENGGQMLVRLLEEQLKLKIEYNPQAEILISTAPGEQPTVHVVGRAAEELKAIRRHWGCSPDDTLNKVVSMVNGWMENGPADRRDSIHQLFRLVAEVQQRGENFADVLNQLKGGTG